MTGSFRRSKAALPKLWLLAALGLAPFACGRATKSSSPNAESSAGGDNADTGDDQASVGGAEDVAGAPHMVLPSAGAPNLLRHPCTNPTLDPLSKLVSCAEGYAHRPEPTVCDTRRADETGFGGAPVDLTTTGCADGCNSVPGGVCVRSDDDLDDGWDCTTSCLVDDDCPRSQMCLCGELGGTCTVGDCRSDSDCDEGLLCATLSVCGGTLFRCQRPQDECDSDSDCGEEVCNDNLEGVRQCATVICG